VSDKLDKRVKVRWPATGADTDGGGITVTRSDPGDGALYATGVQCSGDAAALVTIESPAGSVLWRKRFTGVFNMAETFAPGTLGGLDSEAMLVKISASTTNSEANLEGQTAHTDARV
jgi:hypothetical protein